MDIKTRVDGNKTRVSLSGAIDIPGAETLKTSLDPIIAGHCTELTLDFAGVNFIGSSGIGKLLMIYKDFTASGGRMSIINVNKEIAMVFQDAKLDKLFNI